MLNIRLSRVGKKGHAQYKVVVAEKTSPVKGKFVEQLGSYDPHTKELTIKNDRVEHWISNGAACSTTVRNLFIEKDIIKGDKIKLTFKKKDEEGDSSDDNKKGAKDVAKKEDNEPKEDKKEIEEKNKEEETKDAKNTDDSKKDQEEKPAEKNPEDK